MQIIITGGAGFLGQLLAKAVLDSELAFDDLLLVDIVMPSKPAEDGRVTCRQVDLAAEGVADSIISPETGIVFHLAAVVSSHAEKDFDLGWKVNLDITRRLLEACRQQNTAIKFVFASSLAVFGGALPAIVDDITVVTPHSSYGTQKAIGELLVNDYTRKNFVDGRVFRLPTICIRHGRPNLAASSFVSSIVREPLNGEQAICPVSPGLLVLVSSPEAVIHNLIRGSIIDATAFGEWRTVNLPAISVTVHQMIDSLERIGGKAVISRIKFEPDQAINDIVCSWPVRLDNTRSIRLGFRADENFDQIITQFIQSNKPRE